MIRGKALFFGRRLSWLVSWRSVAGLRPRGGAVVVTPSNPGGRNMADARPGGAVNFVADSIAPQSGAGALQLTTDATTTSKAQYIHDASGSLVDVSDLSYYASRTRPTFLRATRPINCD